MTVLRTLLLASTAGIVAVATAQAADLPTRKAAPVEYVRVCDVGGVTGWTLPGSDTCVKFSGYITAQFDGGNLNTQYNWASTSILEGITSVPPLPFGTGLSTQRVLVAASEAQGNTIFHRDQTGWTTRANFGFDMASNTAYGPLIGHFDLNSETANGFDTLGATTYLDTGYLTWAGDHRRGGAIVLLVHGRRRQLGELSLPRPQGLQRASAVGLHGLVRRGLLGDDLGGKPWPRGGSGPGIQMTGAAGSNPGSITFGGQRWPDIVGALHVKQGWGEAQLSGVIHDVNVTSNAITSGAIAADSCGVAAIALVNCDSQHTQIGWGIDAGVKVNLPQLGEGDNVLVDRRLQSERGLVWGHGRGRDDVGRGRPGQRQRSADVSRRRCSSTR